MRKTKYIPYIGNGAYCYADSISMLLASTGEQISPFTVEVLSGAGLGAFILKGTSFLFFGWEVPDNGIDNALRILGFNCKAEKISKKDVVPIEQLKESLKESTAVIGPLDMGYLAYDPRHTFHRGADHFVLIYEINKEGAYLHDPAGFPHVILSLDNLKLAWKAEEIGYSKEFYRYWSSPKRIKSPTDDDIYKSAIQLFKGLYKRSQERSEKEGWIIGKDAILSFTDRIRSSKAEKEEIEHLIYFALPLGAKRAIDYFVFFEAFDRKLADLKKNQAVLFGEAHTFAVSENWKELSARLEELSQIEEKFRLLLFSKQ